MSTGGLERRQHSAECAELPLGSECICNVAADDKLIDQLADALEALYLINSDEIGSFDPTPEFQDAIDKARAALRAAGRLP